MPDDEAPPSPWTPDVAAKFEGKQYSQYYDPCQEAANRSIKCMYRNNNDRLMCSDYFQAYRDCKKQWQEKRREARRKAG